MRLIEDRFELLPLRIKIEFFLFPLIVLSLLSYSFYSNKKIEDKNEIKTLNINSIKMKDDFVNILKRIETFSNKNNINLLSINRNNGTIRINFDSTMEKRLKFLHFIETLNNFSKIETLQILDNNLSVEVSFNRYYKKDLKNLELISKNRKNKIVFNLNAIVANRAFINGKWLNIGDTINSFKIIKIENKGVILNNDDEIIQLKLYK